MSTQLAHCPNLPETLARLRRLYVDRDPGIVLATMSVPSPTLARFAREHTAGFCAYPAPEERAAFWDTLLQERAVVRDDAVPAAYLSEMDQGLYGGLLGGDARFLCDPATGWISSMVPPILADLAQIDRLSPRYNAEWLARYDRQLAVFAKAARGRFGRSHFILIDSLNLVFELVGATQTYVETLDRPELVRRAVDLAFDLNLMVQERFFAAVGLLAGGTCGFAVQWLPGRIITESVDPFHMASVDYFEQWGREPVERIFARFDGGVLHIHGNGRHLLEAVSTVRGLKAIMLGDDKGIPPAFAVLADLRPRVGNTPLCVGVEFRDFVQALDRHQLTGGVIYGVHGLPDADTANRCMERVRAYRA